MKRPAAHVADRRWQVAPDDASDEYLVERRPEPSGELSREESTIKTHMKRILAKLELRGRIRAVILAYETALVRPGN